MENSNTITKRISQLISVGGLPSIAIGTIGDLLSPKGGWIVIGLIGFLALLLLIGLILFKQIKGESFKETKIYKWTTVNDEHPYVWSGSTVFTIHAVHVVTVFAVISLFIAGKSYAAAQNGGVIASKVEAVKVAQDTLGISKELLVQQQKTNEQLGKLNNTAENIKKEISEDPRKELANLRIEYSESALLSAVRNQDFQVINLFAAAGFTPRKYTGSIVMSAIETKNLKVLESLNLMNLESGFVPRYFGFGLYSRDQFPEDCDSLLKLSEKPELVKAEIVLKIIKNMCGSNNTKNEMKNILANYEKKGSDWTPESIKPLKFLLNIVE